MKGTIKTTTVCGKTFNVWSDFMKKGTYAEDENGEIKRISGSYLSNDLTIRKEIAIRWHMPTFRK